MDPDDSQSPLRRYAVPIGLGVAACAFLLIGVFSYLKPSQNTDITFEPAEASVQTAKTMPTEQLTPADLVVHVDGAVAMPGVYHLGKDSRVEDALIAAGGLTKSADEERVRKSVNLAAKVTDGTKIYIPEIGDTDLTVQLMSNQSGTSETGRIVNINTATAEALDTLPGVGKITADKIINGRPYSSVDDLLNRKIISKSVYEKIKERVGI